MCTKSGEFSERKSAISPATISYHSLLHHPVETHQPNMATQWGTSKGAQRLQPFLFPLTFFGIIPSKSTGWRRILGPATVCCVMLTGTTYATLQVFFCTDASTTVRDDPTHQGFLGIISIARRNMQLFCGGFTICLFCWKARQVPHLLARSNELLQNDVLHRKYFIPLVVYFILLMINHLGVLTSHVTLPYIKPPETDQICFGLSHPQWRTFDDLFKYLEMVVTTYLSGLLSGMILLLYDCCHEFREKAAQCGALSQQKKVEFPVQKVRQLQEKLITFNEECKGVFSVLHFLVLSDAISVIVVIVNLFVPPPRSSAEIVAESIPSPDNGNSSSGLVGDVPLTTGAWLASFLSEVNLWGILGPYAVAFVVLAVANLALQSMVRRMYLSKDLQKYNGGDFFSMSSSLNCDVPVHNFQKWIFYSLKMSKI